MAVLRIVANLSSASPAELAAFYADLLGLRVAMDMGWIVTLDGGTLAAPQLSVASEGGSGAPLPDVSIEVDDLNQVWGRRGRPDTQSSTARSASPGASGASICATPAAD